MVQDSHLLIVLCACLIGVSSCFQVRHRITRSSISMHFEEAITGNTALAAESLPAQRYIATNRFKVRDNNDAKFEKRWADRTSRIANLPGFRFFTLLRRVKEYGADYSDDGNFGNYISMTVWENKETFDDWRTGDAFKEAHGGGGITDFIKLLTTAIFILDGGPKPAFYDGLLPLNGKKLEGMETEGGWRKVDADGQTLIKPDVFVVQNRFKVAAGQEVEFERLWVNRKSELETYDGFVFFSMMRRDAGKADDGYNYISMTVWKDRPSFDVWKGNQKSTHGQGSSENNTSEQGKEKPNMKTMLISPPKVAFYEGKLALASELGA